MSTDVVLSNQLSLTASHQVLILGTVALLVFVPGFLVIIAGAMAGSRRAEGEGRFRVTTVVLSLAAAPAVTFGGASVLSEIFALAGIRWDGSSFAWGFAALTAVAALLCGVLRIISTAVMARFRDPEPAAEPVQSGSVSRTGRVLTAIVVALVAAAGTAAIVRAVGGLDTTVPNWDAMFHSTAMRWIAENGQACSTCLAEVNEPENPNPYYPSAYHAVSAIGILLTGWQMPGTYVALIALTVAIFAVGCAAMVGQFGGGAVAQIVGAAIAVIAPFYPTDLVTYGQVAPLGMAIAVLPGTIAASVAALRYPSPGVIPVIALGIVGVTALHPSVGLVVVAAVALHGVWEVLGRLIGLLRRRHGHEPAEAPRRSSVGWVVLGALIAGALLWWTVKTETASDLTGFNWPAVDDIPGSIEHIVWLGAAPEPLRYLMLGLAAIGLVGIFSLRPGLRVAVPTIIVGATVTFLAVLARGTDAQWAENFTYLWWNDWNRLAALSVVGWVAACGAGAEGLMRLVRSRRLWGRGSDDGDVGKRVLSVVLAVALIGSTLVVGWVTEPVRAERASRGYVEEGRLVTDAELEAYQWLAERYDGGVVLNDSQDGSPWLYAVFGVPVMFNIPLTGTAEARYGPDRMLLVELAHDAGVLGAVYEREAAVAIERFDVRWVIYGPTGLFSRQEPAGGFLKLDESPAYNLVYLEDGVHIYQVDRELLDAENPAGG